MCLIGEGIIGIILKNWKGKAIWRLGEKICRDDFGRRLTLFKYLVQNVIAYGVEIWGWEEKKELGKVLWGLCQMVIQIRLLYTKVCNFEGINTR